MKKFYGNIDLRALRGSEIVTDEEGRECVRIPIDVGNLRRSTSHVYLPFFMFEFKKYTYDYMIIRSQTKEERETKSKTEFLGNAINVVNDYSKDNQKQATPSPSDNEDGQEYTY